MKGQLESLGITIIFLVILMVIVTIAIAIVLFAHGNQIKFSTEYTSIVNKPYSISEPLLRKDVDARTVIEHSFAISLMKDVRKAELGPSTVVDEINLFMEKYSFRYYSVEITRGDDTIVRRWNYAKFCGTLEKKCGPANNQPCIAYCEPPRGKVFGIGTGYCSAGRISYTQGNSICEKEICCLEENYNWDKNQYESLKPQERACSNNKGICSITCETGRIHDDVGDKDCKDAKIYEGLLAKDTQCCKPVNPDNLGSQGELGSEVDIPLLYKTTEKDPNGVLGHLIVGVSRD